MTTQRNPWNGRDDNLESPPTRFEPADYSAADHEFATVTRALRVFAGAQGSLVVRAVNDTADATLSYPAGLWWEPGEFTHIRHTGSTAGYTVHGCS